MPEPALIEIVPPTLPPGQPFTVPGSKSITNRALILAALARHRVVLEGALWSEDTQVMVDALRQLGIDIAIQPDPAEMCNRVIAVDGREGAIGPGGSEACPKELFVGNAGTAARFLAPLVCLGQGVYRLSGVPRMHQRPQADLFKSLRELGYRVDSPNDKLPALIHGTGPRISRCSVNLTESSQFASALLLSAGIGRWEILIQGDNEEESPYVTMTEKLLKVFPFEGGQFQVEPDASSGSYFWGAGGSVAQWPQSGWQIDSEFPRFLPLPPRLSRRSDLGDSIMTAIVLAPLSDHPVLFTDLGRLRVQECERVLALRTELGKCGARVEELGDSLTVFPSVLHGAEIETYDDHRIAMCFAMLGLSVGGMRIRNPACVKKTFPNFFAKLAAPAPLGWAAPVWRLSSPGGERLERLSEQTLVFE